MKKIITSIIIFSFILISCNKETKKQETSDLSTDRIEILEFFGKHRCTSCINIEHNTKETLKKHFQKEIDNKQIVYKMIQWDDPKNDYLVNKFEAAGTSLIIYRVKDGKEFIHDISDFAFKENENIEAFVEQLNRVIKLQLEKQ